MADEPSKWYSLLLALLERPEKGALFIVLIAGCWRWLRELLHTNKDYVHHETFTEMLIRENKEQREENHNLRKEILELQKQLAKEEKD